MVLVWLYQWIKCNYEKCYTMDFFLGDATQMSVYSPQGRAYNRQNKKITKVQFVEPITFIGIIYKDMGE